MLNFIMPMDMSWLNKATTIEQEVLQILEELATKESHNISLFWIKKDMKKLYQDRFDLIQNKDKEINTYTYFLRELESAYALVGSLKYSDIFVIYRQAIYFGTLN